MDFGLLTVVFICNDFDLYPKAYSEGLLKQDYKKVMASLDPIQQYTMGNSQSSISLGADVNAREINGRTPLRDAANQGHLDVRTCFRIDSSLHFPSLLREGCVNFKGKTIVLLVRFRSKLSKIEF